MQTTHCSVVSAVFVAKAAPNAEISLTWLFERLKVPFVKKTAVIKNPNNMQTTHSSVVSVLLVVKAAP